jgi:hypothetical protein
MKNFLQILIACFLLGAASIGVAKQADSTTGPLGGVESAIQDGKQAAFQGSGMTLSQAVEQVRRQYRGRIVSAETKVSGGRETHVIKVLTEDGKVKTVTIPGRRV